MKISTESGRVYNLTPISDNQYPQSYLVETTEDGREERYTADLIAPEKVIKGLGLLMLAGANTDTPRYITTDSVVELDETGETVAAQVLRAFENSATDFRTLESLAGELGIDQDAVWAAIYHLGDRIRRPLGHFGLKYGDWFRLTSRGPTREERLHGYKD